MVLNLIIINKPNTGGNTNDKQTESLSQKPCQGSLTPEVTEAISEAFNTKELIKIAVLKNCFDDPGEMAQMIAERTKSQVVQVIGKKIVLYKESKDHKKIELPK